MGKGCLYMAWGLKGTNLTIRQKKTGHKGPAKSNREV
ncbi:hypothetical protein GGR95_001423 [Sulfitobacter undariae]|uniref:Uncharacterized protein n=1 Tax=Sulfitobacter undariae TaxID=1563671 RepID=A0A7W6E6Y6_9RHOB|nr:hypothetical protein [Sulfitobacter undariae]